MRITNYLLNPDISGNSKSAQLYFIWIVINPVDKPGGGMIVGITIGAMVALALFWDSNRDDEREEISQYMRRILSVGRSD